MAGSLPAQPTRRSASGRGAALQGFVLRANIERFATMLANERSPRPRRFLSLALGEAKRELALLEADAGLDYAPFRPARSPCSDPPSTLQRRIESSQRLLMLLHPGPGLHIVDVSPAYAKATLTDPARMTGERLFDVFPDNPQDPTADGVSNLFASLRKAAEAQRVDVMPLQRYDVRDAQGGYVERHWSPTNTPMFDHRGRVRYILHEVEDVTARALAARDKA